MKKKKIKQTNFDINVKYIDDYTKKSFQSLKLLISAMKENLIDINVYNKTLQFIESQEIEDIIKILNKTKNG